MKLQHRILHICTVVPHKMSGGNIAVRADSIALSMLFENVDCVCRYQLPSDIRNLYNTVYYDNNEFKKSEKINNYLRGHFDDFYDFWEKTKHIIDFNSYSLIFVEFSKYEYIFKDIRHSEFNGVLVLRAHNVEKIFYDAMFSKKKTMINWIKKTSIQNKERKCLDLSDLIISITENDINDFREVYDTDKSKFRVMPIGVDPGILREDDIREFSGGSEKMKCLLTGSLWFGPNVDGIIWFLDEVYGTVSDICDITIAGFKPIPELKNRCKLDKIRLIDSPPKMNAYFMSSDMVLVPIFAGSGMKIKVAEAMSYALPVVTTRHGAIGYEIENGVDGYVVNDAQEFSNSIKTYYALSKLEKMKFKKQVYRKFESKYSYKSMKQIMERNLNKFFD